MRLPVLTPCHEAFDAMTGDGGSRHCDKCDEKVFDLSGRTEEDTMALLSTSEHLCVRYAADSSGNVRFKAAGLVASLCITACSAVDQGLPVQDPNEAVSVPEEVDGGESGEVKFLMGKTARPQWPQAVPTRAYCNAGEKKPLK